MARMKFLCDAERCIGVQQICVTACKQEHDIPWGVNRRRVRDTEYRQIRGNRHFL